MIFTHRARKKMLKWSLESKYILAVLSNGLRIDETQKRTTSNGSGGQRLLTDREKHVPTTLKHIDHLYVRFRTENELVIDVYMSDHRG